jgi:alkaline phosphatase
LTTVLELAQKAGYQTGNVTTAELTDATPAVLDSHVSLRGCQGPADMAPCPGDAKPAGLGSVAEQTIDHKVDVLMGGGRQRFDQATVAGPTVLAQAQAAGYTIATDKAGLDAADPHTPFLGLFAKGNMDLVWTGPLATPYPGPAPTACTKSNPARPATEPQLTDMTSKALDLLESKIIEAQTAADHSPGSIATLITADIQPMVINYATNLPGRSQSHTGTEVRIAAQGPQATNVVGVTDQTDLFHTMSRALGVD